tara:strand:+ start:7947 stop:8879 length:933 start_codon:yes stop_codon:yes gene_type:complete
MKEKKARVEDAFGYTRAEVKVPIDGEEVTGTVFTGHSLTSAMDVARHHGYTPVLFSPTIDARTQGHIRQDQIWSSSLVAKGVYGDEEDLTIYHHGDPENDPRILRLMSSSPLTSRGWFQIGQGFFEDLANKDGVANARGELDTYVLPRAKTAQFTHAEYPKGNALDHPETLAAFQTRRRVHEFLSLVESSTIRIGTGNSFPSPPMARFLWYGKEGIYSDVDLDRDNYCIAVPSEVPVEEEKEEMTLGEKIMGGVFDVPGSMDPFFDFEPKTNRKPLTDAEIDAMDSESVPENIKELMKRHRDALEDNDEE